MDNQKISMPTEAEKQRAIARILDAGLPRRVAFGRELREVLQRIGPRALLFGVGDCLALSLLIWALCLLSALFVAGSTGSLAPALFLFSPLLYAALSLLTAWKNLQTGIWEWTWTFQVSARMVAALQMLCFGGVSVLVCVPANMLLWTFTGQEMPLIWPRTAEWLTAIPTVVFCLLAAAGITLYLLELRCFCRRPMEGGVSYALR